MTIPSLRDLEQRWRKESAHCRTVYELNDQPTSLVMEGLADQLAAVREALEQKLRNGPSPLELAEAARWSVSVDTKTYLLQACKPTGHVWELKLYTTVIGIAHHANRFLDGLAVLGAKEHLEELKLHNVSCYSNDLEAALGAKEPT